MDSVEWADIGERVRACRLAAGRSQAELARAVGLDRTMLAKVEAGTRRLDALELARFAAVLDVPMEYFLEDRPLVLSRRAHLADDVGSLSDTQSYRLDAKLQQWLYDVQQLCELGLFKPPGPMVYPKPVLDEQSARDAALWLRQELGIGTEPIDTLMAVSERAGQLVLVADLPGDGASLVEGEVAVAVVSRAADPGRRRASGAHELGHMVIGDEYSSDIGAAASRNERERVIDAFAAELLLPAEVLAGVERDEESGVRAWLIEHAARYRTSWSLAVRQALRSELVDGALARRLQQTAPTRAEFMEALGWAPQVDLESVTVPPSYAHAVLEAWRRSLVTSDRAVEMMHGQITAEDLPSRDDADLMP